MRDHYAIVAIDAQGRVSSVKVRINDTFYSCDVHDNGVGARELTLPIDNFWQANLAKVESSGREQALAREIKALKRQFSR